MYHDISFYYLYCMNIQCQASIYNTMAIRIPNNTGHRAIHRCNFCNHPLASESDVEVTYMITKVNSQKPKKPNYQLN